MPARPDPQRLWAPWRGAWIAAATRASGRRGSKDAPAEPPCLFCRVTAARKDRDDLVLVRRPRALLMLNRYPYNPGHVMVAVCAHKARVQELTAAERRDVFDLVAVAERALETVYQPHGVNYGANVGRVAGAGFPGHLHLHLVPRWDGDTNFMTVVGSSRVLPESLGQTWRRLRRAANPPRRGGKATRGAQR